MFIYLEDRQIVISVDKIVKIYIDNLTTVRVILENNHGFDILHDSEDKEAAIAEAEATLKYLVDRLDLNEPWEGKYD